MPCQDNESDNGHTFFGLFRKCDAQILNSRFKKNLSYRKIMLLERGGTLAGKILS